MPLTVYEETGLCTQMRDKIALVRFGGSCVPGIIVQKLHDFFLKDIRAYTDFIFNKFRGPENLLARMHVQLCDRSAYHDFLFIFFYQISSPICCVTYQ